MPLWAAICFTQTGQRSGVPIANMYPGEIKVFDIFQNMGYILYVYVRKRVLY